MDLAQRKVNREYAEYWDMVLDGNRRKILAVDDDSGSLGQMESLISQLNPETIVLTAQSPEDALALAQLTHFDFALVEYVIGGNPTGMDLCGLIRQIEPNTNCVIVSRVERTQYQELVSRNQAPPDFLEKPVTPGALKEHRITS